MIKSRLLILMQKHNLSRYKLSKLSGVPDPALRRLIENNYKELPIEYLEKLCKFFNCGIGDLLEYSDLGQKKGKAKIA